MSRFNQNDTRNLSSLPPITLITCGYKQINQTYPNINHIIIDDLPVPQAFNQGMPSSQHQLCCFLDDKFDFVNESVLEQIMNVFLTYNEVGCVYTDNITQGHHNFYPSNDYNLITQEHIVIQTPIVFYNNINAKFPEQDLNTYYANVIKYLSQHTIVHHIPEPLFISTND